MKKTWNKPRIVKLDVSKTAGGHQIKKYESKCHHHDSSTHGYKACAS